jgi:hypothetical protein
VPIGSGKEFQLPGRYSVSGTPQAMRTIGIWKFFIDRQDDQKRMRDGDSGCVGRKKMMTVIGRFYRTDSILLSHPGRKKSGFD